MEKFLKRLTHKAKREHKHRLLSLPAHILAIILNKLDVATLSSNQDVFAAALPEVSSLSISLPPSLFLPKRSTLWYGKLLDHILKKTLTFCNLKQELRFTPKLYELTFSSLLWLHTPRICASGKRLFQKLTGLKSLEVELPVPDTANDRLAVLNNSNLWLRWDAKLGTSKPDRDYALYVLGDIVSDQVVEDESQDELAPLRRLWTITCLLMFHCCTVQSLLRKRANEDASKTVVVSKDPGEKGSMQFNPKCFVEPNSLFSNGRVIVYNLPTGLRLKSSGSTLLVNNIWLYLLVDDEAHEDPDDCIRACLGNVGEKKKELREAVTKLLAKNKRNIVFDQTWE